MIAGTNTDCKILNIEIQDSTAIVTLLLFANKTTFPAKAFQFYIQNKNDTLNEITLASNNIYWVDYNTSFTNDLNNININKYREVKLEIDITNSNSSLIIDNKWVRECYIHILDTESILRKPAWSSDLLTLISKEFQTPQIKSFTYYSEFVGENLNEDYYKIHLDVALMYESQIDYNYSNKNFYYIVNIKSASTDSLLETIVSPNAVLPSNFSIESSDAYPFNRAIILELIIKNKLNQTILKYSKSFMPTKKLSNTFVKTKEGIKRVLGFYVNRNIKEDFNKSEWLEGGELNE